SGVVRRNVRVGDVRRDRHRAAEQGAEIGPTPAGPRARKAGHRVPPPNRLVKKSPTAEATVAVWVPMPCAVAAAPCGLRTTKNTANAMAVHNRSLCFTVGSPFQTLAQVRHSPRERGMT